MNRRQSSRRVFDAWEYKKLQKNNIDLGHELLPGPSSVEKDRCIPCGKTEKQKGNVIPTPSLDYVLKNIATHALTSEKNPTCNDDVELIEHHETDSTLNTLNKQLSLIDHRSARIEKKKPMIKICSPRLNNVYAPTASTNSTLTSPLPRIIANRASNSRREPFHSSMRYTDKNILANDFPPKVFRPIVSTARSERPPILTPAAKRAKVEMNSPSVLNSSTSNTGLCDSSMPPFLVKQTRLVSIVSLSDDEDENDNEETFPHEERILRTVDKEKECGEITVVTLSRSTSPMDIIHHTTNNGKETTNENNREIEKDPKKPKDISLINIVPKEPTDNGYSRTMPDFTTLENASSISAPSQCSTVQRCIHPFMSTKNSNNSCNISSENISLEQSKSNNRQSSSRSGAADDRNKNSEPFCQNCVSEFPIILKTLERLDERLDGMKEMMKLAVENARNGVNSNSVVIQSLKLLSSCSSHRSIKNNTKNSVNKLHEEVESSKNKLNEYLIPQIHFDGTSDDSRTEKDDDFAFLSALEKEILKVAPNIFEIGDLMLLSRTIKAARFTKTIAALEHLEKLRLIKLIRLGEIHLYRKSKKRIDQIGGIVT